MDAEQKKGKKGRKDKNAVDDYDINELLAEEPQVAETQPSKPETKPAKEKKGGKNKNDLDNLKGTEPENDEEGPSTGPQIRGKKGAKADKVIMVDDHDGDAVVVSDVALSKNKKGGKAKKVEDEEDDDEGEQIEKKIPEKKGRKGKKAVDDYDIDAVLAEEPVAESQPKKQESKLPVKGKKDKKGKNDTADDDADSDGLEESKPAASDKPPVKAKKQTKGKDDLGDHADEEKPDEKQGGDSKPEKPAADGAKKLTKREQGVLAMKENLRKIQEEKDRLEREEDERIRKLEEEDQKRLDDIQKEKDRKDKKKQKEKERKDRLKAEGKFLTPKQKQEQARAQAMIESLKAQGVQMPNVGEKVVRSSKPAAKKSQRQASVDQKTEEPVVVTELVELVEVDSSESLGEWDQISSNGEENDEPELDSPTTQTQQAVEMTTAKERITQKLGNLRSAVVCVLGHVDTGKTKILDRIRRTNVQDMEAGGITQQIGATMVPADAIVKQSSMARGFTASDIRLPGLLIIDTPGHESFSNLRSRGSSLCDIAILVVDIMHGLEPQTIESLNLLKARKSPFIVALNKIDRLFDWKTLPGLDIRDALDQQKRNVVEEFKERCQKIVVEFAEQGLNAALFYENPDPKTFISMVPTSAISGDGMGNLMSFIVELCQTMLTKRLTFSTELQCTVLEVKELTGLGTTVDVILTNGTLTEGDTIILAGFEGPVITQVRGLLMPQPLRELRVKNPYEKHKVIHGAQGVKILAKDLDTCLAGLPLYVANTAEDQEKYKKEIEDQLESALKSIKREERGVYVQASTLGSLEALLEFLKTSKIPYCGINIGPVHKKDVRNASAMLEHDAQYAVILAFDVKVEREAQQLADELGIRIFAADIIYHLFDRFTQYQDELKEKKREENKHLAIFPCKLKILPQFVFNTRDPIIVGVIVEAGILKVGTPLCVPAKEFVEIGIVTSIEVNHKAMDIAKKGQEICIKIDPDQGSAPKLLGRHFEIEDTLVSKITRPSIDVCKDYFRDDLTKADWQLMVELKKLLNVF